MSAATGKAVPSPERLRNLLGCWAAEGGGKGDVEMLRVLSC